MAARKSTHNAAPGWRRGKSILFVAISGLTFYNVIVWTNMFRSFVKEIQVREIVKGRISKGIACKERGR